jgi:hypothetical protein
MSSQAVTVYLVEMITRAESGVDYRPRTGALCPACGKAAKIFATRPWEANFRIRYHKCRQSGCVLASTGTTIKSVEVEK